ncbi:protein hunchback-like [Ornithodoros turicata]|uniref:protein hunchback-like n=1 Tax=Ornithodoros turicata TaxID=34597 RepID=UPI00313971F6
MKSCETGLPWLAGAPQMMSRPEVQDSNGCDIDSKLGSQAASSPGSPFSREQGEGLTSSCEDSEDSVNAGPDNSNPLAQLQTALEKSGLLGVQLTDIERKGQMQELYRCHLCTYQGTSQLQYGAHMSSHFDHKCPFCDYTSRTEGRLKRHVKDFHSEVPPESWAGTRVPRTDDGALDGGKERKFRCKQCGHVADSKNDFWEHSKVHIRSEKLLTCPKCPFVTEYKHHLEYHLRNHFGSKPFKCGKCNYSCVNKSMLNSHMKSHSNVYQYRCADCNYATKYCHSLKLHLRKYLHKPATVLNLDGSPNPYPVVDVYGTRRGPRPRKKFAMAQEDPVFPNTMQGNFQPTQLPPLIPVSSVGFAYPPHLMNGYRAAMMMGAQMLDGMNFQQQQHEQQEQNSLNNVQTGFPAFAPRALPWKDEEPRQCTMCGFTSTDKELFNQHVLQHSVQENQDQAYTKRESVLVNETSMKVEEPEELNPSRVQSQATVDVSFVSSTSNLEGSAQPLTENGTIKITPEEPVSMDLNEVADVHIESHTETKDSPTPAKARQLPLDLSRPNDIADESPVAPPVRNRRKGRAVRLDRICMKLQTERGSDISDKSDELDTVTEVKTSSIYETSTEAEVASEVGSGTTSPAAPAALQQTTPERGVVQVQDAGKPDNSSDSTAQEIEYRCAYCDIVFKHCVMYTVHMGYHGYHDPFTCNMCGQQSEDKVAFFLHIARAAHL